MSRSRTCQPTSIDQQVHPRVGSITATPTSEDKTLTDHPHRRGGTPVRRTVRARAAAGAY